MRKLTIIPQQANVFTFLSIVLLVGGCATGRAPAPAPSSEGTASIPSAPPPSRPAPDEPQIAAYVPPREPELVRPQPNRAVQALSARADDQFADENYVAAAGTLERALRIAPKDPLLWNKLAHVRFSQKQYAMASELASKSLSTAGKQDISLKRDNWNLIATAKRSLGDEQGARQAERKAAELR
ncbi:MAG: hypothetical protein ACWA5Q_06580 [bacterium]